MENEMEQGNVAAVIFKDGTVQILPGAMTLVIFEGTARLRRMINAEIKQEPEPQKDTKAEQA